MSAHDCRKNPAIYLPMHHKHSPHGLTSACLLHDCTTPPNYFISTETHHMINIRGTLSLSNPPNTTSPKIHMLNTWLKRAELNTPWLPYSTQPVLHHQTLTHHVFDIRVVHGCPGGAVAPNGPGEEDDVIWLKPQAVNGVLHDSINGVLFSIWEGHALSATAKKGGKKSVLCSCHEGSEDLRFIVNPVYLTNLFLAPWRFTSLVLTLFTVHSHFFVPQRFKRP